jgi:short-subunit dehydrogenase
VNISSLSSSVNSSYLIPYSSSKAAVNQATLSLANEYAPYGVTVKGFLGGKIATESYRQSLNESYEIDKVDPVAFANNCLDFMSSSTLSSKFGFWSSNFEFRRGSYHAYDDPRDATVGCRFPWLHPNGQESCCEQRL